LLEQYKVTYEVLNPELTKKAQETHPNVKDVYEGYFKVVEAPSLWQALAVFGAALGTDTLKLEDFQGSSNPGVCRLASTKFNIVSVNRVQWFQDQWVGAAV
jgi:hypothetical protein